MTHTLVAAFRQRIDDFIVSEFEVSSRALSSISIQISSNGVPACKVRMSSPRNSRQSKLQLLIPSKKGEKIVTTKILITSHDSEKAFVGLEPFIILTALGSFPVICCTQLTCRSFKLVPLEGLGFLGK